MICKLFEELTPRERVEMIGKIVHAMQTDELCFLEVSQTITHAEAKGVFDKVKILPGNEEDSVGE